MLSQYAVHPEVPIYFIVLIFSPQLLKDEKRQPPKPKIPLPEHLQIRPVTPVEKYIKVV